MTTMDTTSLVDTKLLAGLSKWNGDRMTWKAWSFAFRGYVGLLSAVMKANLDCAAANPTEITGVSPQLERVNGELVTVRD